MTMMMMYFFGFFLSYFPFFLFPHAAFASQSLSCSSPAGDDDDAGTKRQ